MLRITADMDRILTIRKILSILYSLLILFILSTLLILFIG